MAFGVSSFQFPRGLTRQDRHEGPQEDGRFQFPRGLTDPADSSVHYLSLRLFQFPRGLTDREGLQGRERNRDRLSIP